MQRKESTYFLWLLSQREMTSNIENRNLLHFCFYFVNDFAANLLTLISRPFYGALLVLLTMQWIVTSTLPLNMRGVHRFNI